MIFSIFTFGCRLNQAESATYTKKLIDLGYQKENNYKLADIVILNSCCVTHKAEREVRQQLRRIKRENLDCFLVLVGCLAEKLKTEDMKKTGLDKIVDLKVGKNKKDLLVTLLDKKLQKKRVQRKNKVLNNAVIDKYHNDQKALIKIQTGCNNFCSYCIVPYVRGEPKSVLAELILGQVKDEIQKGVREIILTGVDLALYKFVVVSSKLKRKTRILGLDRHQNDFVMLLKLILSETKLEKISFGSISLAVFDNEFFDFYQENDAVGVSKHFHIPLQSGSDAVLARMKRPYRVSDFISTVKRLKNEVPGSSLSTDIIVGFPGETTKEYRQTLKTLSMIKNIMKNNFTKVHTFRYSNREKTLATRKEKEGLWQKVDSFTKRKRAYEIIRKYQSVI